jgi:hypothetical protein
LIFDLANHLGQIGERHEFFFGFTLVRHKQERMSVADSVCEARSVTSKLRRIMLEAQYPSQLCRLLRGPLL